MSRIPNIPVYWGSTVNGVSKGDWVGVDSSNHDLVIPGFKIVLGANGVDGGYVSAANPLPVSFTGGGSGDGAILDGVSSAIKATVLDYVNSNPLAVRLTDTNGDYIAAGGGTQYTEDAASAADPTGTQVILRRRDSLATETSTDGDVTAANCTGKGEMYVKHVDTLAVSAASLPLPTGAATEATVATLLTLAGFQARINTLGQKTMANSTPVVLASDQSTLAVSAASLPLPTGAATEATLSTRLADATFTGRINTLGQKTMANSTPVVLASDQSTLPTKETRSGTSAVTSVAGSAASVALLASNANRLGATVYNDSTAILYLKLGATASTSSFTTKLFPEDYYEVPANYTGVIDGIWASATGNARITELT